MSRGEACDAVFGGGGDGLCQLCTFAFEGSHPGAQASAGGKGEHGEEGDRDDFFHRGSGLAVIVSFWADADWVKLGRYGCETQACRCASAVANFFRKGSISDNFYEPFTSYDSIGMDIFKEC